MTRKDYIRVARALREALADESSGVVPQAKGVMGAAEYIARELRDDNNRFDRGHFLAVVRGEKDLNSRPSRS